MCALYAVENSEGVWLCAYYGANRSVFDYLPQKDAEIDEAQLGIAFLHKVFIPKDQYQPADGKNSRKNDSWSTARTANKSPGYARATTSQTLHFPLLREFSAILRPQTSLS